MTLDQLHRAAGRAALTAAVLGVPADLFHFTMESRAAASQSLAFRLHGIALVTAFTLLLLALAGIVLAQQDRAGRLGRVGGLLALGGTALVLGDLAKEAFGLPLAPDQLGEPQGFFLVVVVASFALLTLGWLLTALAAHRSRIASGPAAGLLGVGALLALPPIPGAYVVLLLGVAVVATRLPAPSAQRPAASSAAVTGARAEAVGAPA
jgi:uncharacterized membrane protein